MPRTYPEDSFQEVDAWKEGYEEGHADGYEGGVEAVRDDE